MSLKSEIFVNKSKKKVKEKWYKLMKPVAKIVQKNEDKKYNKKVKKIENMSDEELIKRYSRYLVKRLISRAKYDPIEKFMMVDTSLQEYNKRVKSTIMYQLRGISSSDEYLNDWYLYNEKANLYHDSRNKKLIEYEKKLQHLLAKELEEADVTIYYDYEEPESFSHPSVRSNWYDRIGYTKTMFVTIK